MNFNCPICNQAGLPNYKTEQVICPQCNSDLKPYFLLNVITLRKRSTATKAWPVITGFLLLSCICVGILYYSSSKDFKDRINGNEASLSNLRDSLQHIKYELTQRVYSESTPVEEGVTYTVKEGDNLWNISRSVYGAGRFFKQIVVENKLSQPYVLTIGQKLHTPKTSTWKR